VSEAILETLNRSTLVLVTVDPGGRIQYSNAAAGDLFGRLDGIDLSNPPPCDDPRSPLASLIGAWESLEDRTSPTVPRLVRTKTGGLSNFLWYHSLPLQEGADSGTLFLIVDVTAHLTGSEAVRRVVAQLAHDLRSPLTSVAGAAELLLSGRIGSLEATQDKLVRIVDEGAGKMTRIIQHAAEESAQGGASE
jgi:PAS domain-containing protein